MGYPMTYRRVVSRNGLTGDYAPEAPRPQSLIAGDLRRLEKDQTDEYHLLRYARAAGITPEQAGKVLVAFFNDLPHPTDAEWAVAEAMFKRQREGK